MNRWLEQLLYTLMPGICILCAAPTHRRLDLCWSCEQELPRFSHRCYRCGLPLAAPTHDLCGQCIVNPPPWCRLYCGFIYTAPVDKLVVEFKTEGRIMTGRIMARILAGALASHWQSTIHGGGPPDLLIPVPLHDKKRRQRGFNQSLEIARVLSDRLGIKLDSHVCRRIRDTPAQKKLTASERYANLKDAFILDRPLAGQRVGIVDDVVTTGSTVRAMSSLILAAGACQVEIIALARTPLF